jgi:hypothetical protein
VNCIGGHVTHLFLNNNQLSGTISSKLGDLVDLAYLWLNNNQLSGTIPSELGSLGKLKDLYLSSNQLSGTIPSALGNLINLKILSLNDNQLSGIIPDLSNLTVLMPEANFGYNKLTSETAGSATAIDSDWAATQTIPPANITATISSTDTIQVAWIPITYTSDGGYYQVKYATTAGGPYTNASSTTTNKSATSYDVSGLTANTTYFFVVETFTPKHGGQQNDLTSELSVEVSATDIKPLVITPTKTLVEKEGTASLTVTGGEPPYFWNATEGLISLIDDNTITYIASATLGTVSIVVVDSGDQTATATIEILNILDIPYITTDKVQLIVNETTQLTINSGKPPYSWSVTQGSFSSMLTKYPLYDVTLSVS